MSSKNNIQLNNDEVSILGVATHQIPRLCNSIRLLNVGKPHNDYIIKPHTHCKRSYLFYSAIMQVVRIT